MFKHDGTIDNTACMACAANNSDKINACNYYMQPFTFIAKCRPQTNVVNYRRLPGKCVNMDLSDLNKDIDDITTKIS